MRVATWNVNGLRARLEFVRHWLDARQPDVVALQEIKLSDDQFPHDVFGEAGYRAAVHGEKGWNGVAILARQAPQVVQRGLPGQEASGARLLTVEFEGFLVTSVYVPNGKSVEHPDFGRKLEWLDALVGHLEDARRGSRPWIVGGDFNVCPAPLDSWNEEGLAGHIFHTEAERHRIRRLVDLGLVDLFRSRFPGEQVFSWWDYRGGAFHRKQGLRIDLLLASGSVLPRLKHVEIDREYRKKKEGLTPSDHAPVLAELA